MFKQFYIKELWQFYLYSFLASLLFFSAVFIPFLNEKAKLTNEQIFLLQSIYLLSYFIVGFFSGALADLIGRKTTVMIGLIIYAIGELIYGSFPYLQYLIFAEILFGIASSFIKGTDAILYDYLKKKQLQRYSRRVFEGIGISSMFGIAFASFIGAYIGKISYEYTFLLHL